MVMSVFDSFGAANESADVLNRRDRWSNAPLALLCHGHLLHRGS